MPLSDGPNQSNLRVRCVMIIHDSDTASFTCIRRWVFMLEDMLQAAHVMSKKKNRQLQGLYGSGSIQRCLLASYILVLKSQANQVNLCQRSNIFSGKFRSEWLKIWYTHTQILVVSCIVWFLSLYYILYILYVNMQYIFIACWSSRIVHILTCDVYIFIPCRKCMEMQIHHARAKYCRDADTHVCTCIWILSTGINPYTSPSKIHQIHQQSGRGFA